MVCLLVKRNFPQFQFKTYPQVKSTFVLEFLGKSETMMGTDEDPGIQLLAIEQIFKKEGIPSDHEFKIR